MSDLDLMIQAACANPDDIACRGALADMLDESGEPELAERVRDDHKGYTVILHVNYICDKLPTKDKPTLRHLWAASKNLVYTPYTVFALTRSSSYTASGSLPIDIGNPYTNPYGPLRYVVPARPDTAFVAGESLRVGEFVALNESGRLVRCENNSENIIGVALNRSEPLGVVRVRMT